MDFRLFITHPDGSVTGPHRSAEIYEAADLGSLAGNTQVQIEGTADWLNLETLLSVRSPSVSVRVESGGPQGCWFAIELLMAVGLTAAGIFGWLFFKAAGSNTMEVVSIAAAGTGLICGVWSLVRNKPQAH